MLSSRIGLIFLHAANQGERMFDHLKFCIGIVFFISYTQVIVPILACKYKPVFHQLHCCGFEFVDQQQLICFSLSLRKTIHFDYIYIISMKFSHNVVPGEVKLLKKECFNRWYSLMPYYAALTVSRLPFQVSKSIELIVDVILINLL